MSNAAQGATTLKSDMEAYFDELTAARERQSMLAGTCKSVILRSQAKVSEALGQAVDFKDMCVSLEPARYGAFDGEEAWVGMSLEVGPIGTFYLGLYAMRNAEGSGELEVYAYGTLEVAEKAWLSTLVTKVRSLSNWTVTGDKPCWAAELRTSMTG